ncbi:MAG: hypothetical protein AAF934_04180 [Bacteroidota bacterium]
MKLKSKTVKHEVLCLEKFEKSQLLKNLNRIKGGSSCDGEFAGFIKKGS